MRHKIIFTSSLLNEKISSKPCLGKKNELYVTFSLNGGVIALSAEEKEVLCEGISHDSNNKGTMNQRHNHMWALDQGESQNEVFFGTPACSRSPANHKQQRVGLLEEGGFILVCETW